MHGLLLTVLLLATPQPVEGAWPERVVYLGKPRSEEWLDKVYLHYRERLAEVEGAWVYMSPKTSGHPRYAVEMAPGDCGRVRIKPTKVLGADDFLAQLAGYDLREMARYDYLTKGGIRRSDYGENKQPDTFSSSCQTVRVKGVPMPNAPPNGYSVALAAVGHDVVNGKRYVRCVPVPTDTKPLTIEQFTACLASGFRLYEWRWKRKQLSRGASYRPWYRRYLK